MKTVNFTQFRRTASQLLDLVEKGETIRILRHGRAIAKIVPSDSEPGQPSWKRSGLRLVTEGASLSSIVLEERRSSD